MAKRRPLQEDATTLKAKVKQSLTGHENPEGDAATRSLRKRLKRAQRKIRTVKRQEAQRNAKKGGAES